MQMADKFGLDVVAEGIEQASQRDFLLPLGCTTGQGFLYAKPMPHAELKLWLAAKYAVSMAEPA